MILRQRIIYGVGSLVLYIIGFAILASMSYKLFLSCYILFVANEINARAKMHGVSIRRKRTKKEIAKLRAMGIKVNDKGETECGGCKESKENLIDMKNKSLEEISGIQQVPIGG